MAAPAVEEEILDGAAQLLSLFAATAGAAAPAAGGGGGAPSAAAAPPLLPPAGGWPKLRCLDPSHDDQCARCARAAPPRASARPRGS
jgi:hypothetical protein